MLNAVLIKGLISLQLTLASKMTELTSLSVGLERRNAPRDVKSH